MARLRKAALGNGDCIFPGRRVDMEFFRGRRNWRCSAAVGAALEPRRLMAAAAGDMLALATGDLVRGRHDFADTWHPLAALTKPSTSAVSHLRATKFDAFKLDEADLRQALALAPMEFTA